MQYKSSGRRGGGVKPYKFPEKRTRSGNNPNNIFGAKYIGAAYMKNACRRIV